MEMHGWLTTQQYVPYMSADARRNETQTYVPCMTVDDNMTVNAVHVDDECTVNDEVVVCLLYTSDAADE